MKVLALKFTSGCVYGNKTKTSETNDSNVANNRKLGSICITLNIPLKKWLVTNLAYSSTGIKSLV